MGCQEQVDEELKRKWGQAKVWATVREASAECEQAQNQGQSKGL